MGWGESGLLVPGQPQAVQGAQEGGRQGCAERALGQHQLLQVEVKREAAELLRGEPQPGLQLLIQHLQRGRGAAQWGPWGQC